LMHGIDLATPQHAISERRQQARRVGGPTAPSSGTPTRRATRSITTRTRPVWCEVSSTRANLSPPVPGRVSGLRQRRH
jgi:hypothetical protein